MPPQLPNHFAHHYPALIRRWRAVAAKSDLSWKKYGEQDGFPMFFLQTRHAVPDAPSIYLSTGIHGDEPGATEGTVAWAEANAKTLRRGRFTIFPCLNPWGLTNNSRYNSHGIDLNRRFHDLRQPALQAHRKLIAGSRFDVALTIHEDYDGQGVYIYELNSTKSLLSPIILEAVNDILPTDSRRSIDGRKMTQPGYLYRNMIRGKLPDGPEAIYLARKCADICFTIETPSEFSLDRRIRAHQIMIQAIMQRVLHDRQKL